MTQCLKPAFFSGRIVNVIDRVVNLCEHHVGYSISLLPRKDAEYAACSSEKSSGVATVSPQADKCPAEKLSSMAGPAATAVGQEMDCYLTQSRRGNDRAHSVWPQRGHDLS